MKKYLLLFALGLLSVFMIFGSSLAWQGRMSGMGDPYGLTPDDSDFLIHPALITRGEGFDVYSHFNFTYTDITKWDIDINIYNSKQPFDSSGEQYDYGTLLGTAFDLGAGRMGIFFAYESMNRDIEGDSDYTYSSINLTPPFVGIDNSTSADYDLESDMNDFSFRIIYGQPIEVNCLNVGVETKISYIDEKQSNKWENNDGWSFLNHTITTLWHWSEANTLWFQVPYDSDYWNAQIKGSADGRICLDNMVPIDVTLSFGGGFIFAGDNEYKFEANQSGVGSTDIDNDGDIDGFNLGGDLWVRVPVSDDVALPFLVSVHYNEKTKDGKGTYSNPSNNFPMAPPATFDGYTSSYEHKEDSFLIEAGGGLDMKLSDRSRGTAGLFYTYVNSSDDVVITSKEVPGGPFLGWQGIYEQDVPDYKEHRVTLKLGWETALSSTAAIRTGLKTFYGFIDKDFELNFTDNRTNYEKDKTTLDGYQWGLMASIGGSFMLQSLTLEPYINAGYRDIDMDGDLDINVFLNPGPKGSSSGSVDEDRQEWFVGAGLSILFGT